MTAAFQPRFPERIDCTDAIERCAAGDKAALRALYTSEAGAMLGVGVAILHCRGLAEDAVQDAFVRVWNRASTFDRTRGSGRAWLYTVMRNSAINLLRTGVREVGSEDEATAERAGEQVDERPDPEASLALKDDMQRLQDCLNSMRPEYREALTMAYVSGLSGEEIAATLCVPLGTAKTWIRRASQQVRESMRDTQASCRKPTSTFAKARRRVLGMILAILPFADTALTVAGVALP